MDKKLPELAHYRNITYAEALQEKLVWEKRALRQVAVTQEMIRDTIKVVKAEIKLWINHVES